jgi:hypothetical protein
MADKYPTARLTGVVMTQTNNGTYEPQNSPLTSADFHSWRIGKHTKGKLGQPGQLFLTENNLTVMLVRSEKLAFKDRHEITPMARFMSVNVSDEILHAVLNDYN